MSNMTIIIFIIYDCYVYLHDISGPNGLYIVTKSLLLIFYIFKELTK